MAKKRTTMKKGGYKKPSGNKKCCGQGTKKRK